MPLFLFTAAVVLLQIIPFTGIFLMIVAAPFWPGRTCAAVALLFLAVNPLLVTPVAALATGGEGGPGAVVAVITLELVLVPSLL